MLAEHDVLVKVDMGTGDASAKAWGCDLTYDYVQDQRRLPEPNGTPPVAAATALAEGPEASLE